MTKVKRPYAQLAQALDKELARWAELYAWLGTVEPCGFKAPAFSRVQQRMLRADPKLDEAKS